MITAFVEKDEDQISLLCNDNGRWARVCSILGAAVWAGIAVAARFGFARISGIEALLLFAPLVIVPLGMELRRELTSPLVDNARDRGTLIHLIARWVQPFAAACAVVALLLPPGRLAGALAGGWMLVCALMGAAGIFDVLSSWLNARSRLFYLTLFLAGMDLVVGGVWLVASRLGMRPLGIQEPIGSLTAVHFHYAGFATAMIAAAMLRF
jgi:hypothetical protein